MLSPLYNRPQHCFKLNWSLPADYENENSHLELWLTLFTEAVSCFKSFSKACRNLCKCFLTVGFYIYCSFFMLKLVLTGLFGGRLCFNCTVAACIPWFAVLLRFWSPSFLLGSKTCMQCIPLKQNCLARRNSKWFSHPNKKGGGFRSCEVIIDTLKLKDPSSTLSSKTKLCAPKHLSALLQVFLIICKGTWWVFPFNGIRSTFISLRRISSKRVPYF